MSAVGTVCFVACTEGSRQLILCLVRFLRMAWPVSWLALLLAIPAVQITTCTMGSEDAWLTSLIIWTPLTVAVLTCIWIAHRHHSSLVWLSLPLFVILPYCIYFAGRFLVGTTFQGRHLCSVLLGGFDGYPSS